MKKFLLSLIACAAVTASAVAAPTVDQLVQWGGYAMEVPYGGADRGGLALWSNDDIRIVKTGTNSFDIKGLFAGLFGDGFTIKATGYSSSTGKFTIADETECYQSDGSFGCAIYGLNKNSTYYSSTYGYYYPYSNSSLSCSVTQPDDNRYVITIPSCELASSSANVQLNSIQIHIFKVNGVAADTFNGEARTYPIGYYEDGSSVTVRNLGEVGMQYYCNVVSKKTINNVGFFSTEGTIDSEGNITLNEQYAFSTGCINIEKQKYDASGWSVDPWYQGYDDIKVWKIRGATGSDFTTPKSTILGKKYVTGEVGHVFNRDNHWVSDGGKVKTYCDATIIELDDYAFYTGSTYDDTCEGTVITLSEGEDVTHSADFVKGTLPTDYAYTYYQDKDNVWHKKLVLNGTITNRVNNDYVESYDLFVVPKHLESVDTWDASEHDATKGHKQAVCIASGLKPTMARSASTDIPVHVSLEGDAVPALNTTGNNALFLRANYSKAGMHPTFHSLVSEPITTALETVDLGAAALDITAGFGEITVTGAQQVEVYTLSGVCIYSGAEGNVAVAPGIYVVKADGAVRKVTVK